LIPVDGVDLNGRQSGHRIFTFQLNCTGQSGRVGYRDAALDVDSLTEYNRRIDRLT
jgi:hypothetical protein